MPSPVDLNAKMLIIILLPFVKKFLLHPLLHITPSVDGRFLLFSHCVVETLFSIPLSLYPTICDSFSSECDNCTAAISLYLGKKVEVTKSQTVHL